MGSSLRVSPANLLPQATAERGGNLVICNLQKTPLDDYAALVIHAKCDDIMTGLMERLGYQTPVWKMKKRLEVSLVDNGAKVQFRGVDDTRKPFDLFKKVDVTGIAAKKSWPSR